MKILHSIAICTVVELGAITAIAQHIHVNSENGTVTLSVAAQKPYVLMASGQAKTPRLTVSCQQKGNKITHSITFAAGGILTEQEFSTFGNSASLQLPIKIGDENLSTTWIAYGNVDVFTYYGKTEKERLAFLQVLLNAPSMTIEFTPFLTGVATSSTFDLTELRGEFDKHAQCAANAPNIAH